MTMTPPAETPDVVIGNHTQKYTAKNPAIRWLTARWVDRLRGLLDQIAADSAGAGTRALEVGCGEGVIAQELTTRWPSVTALDLPDAGLRAHWRDRPGPGYLHADAHRLPFSDHQFDVVVAAEVLEHLPDPERGLAEIARVGRGTCCSRSPASRSSAAATCSPAGTSATWATRPGHLNHWSTRSFVRFVSTVAEVRAVTKPFPWTVVWATLRHRG